MMVAITGLGPFYDGLSHFVLTREDLLPALALALLVGLNGARTGRTTLFGLSAAWLGGGLAGLAWPTATSVPALTIVSFLVLGAMVAADQRLRLAWPGLERRLGRAAGRGQRLSQRLGHGRREARPGGPGRHRVGLVRHRDAGRGAGRDTTRALGTHCAACGPALISFDDNQVLGFVVEHDAATDRMVVFLPGAPGAGAGSVVVVPVARVQWLEAPLGAARRAMKQRGFGLLDLAPMAGRTPVGGAPASEVERR